MSWTEMMMAAAQGSWHIDVPPYAPPRPGARLSWQCDACQVTGVSEWPDLACWCCGTRKVRRIRPLFVA